MDNQRHFSQKKTQRNENKTETKHHQPEPSRRDAPATNKRSPNKGAAQGLARPRIEIHRTRDDPAARHGDDMTDTKHDSKDARALARMHRDQGDPLAWFEALYSSAGDDPARIPWADLQPNPALISWLDARQPEAHGQRALVVGCGLGDDAEAIAARGFETTAFDLSSSAISWAQKRFPNSPVRYHTADLLDLPAAWAGGFDLVFEAYTLQAIPHEIRARATPLLADLLRPEGLLLVIARSRRGHPVSKTPPWPLGREDFEGLEKTKGLQVVEWEEFLDEETPPVHRFRALYRRG